jgi:hypothetical protein
VHDLRHSFVSIMVAAGANPKAVSTWAGRSSVSFTLDRYGHLYDDHADDVADQIDALLTAQSQAAEIRQIRSRGEVLPFPVERSATVSVTCRY